MNEITHKEIEGDKADLADLLNTIINGIADGSVHSSTENYLEMVDDVLRPKE